MPHLILTPGDPTGIGPEITVKALRRLGEFPDDLKLTVVGKINGMPAFRLRQEASADLAPDRQSCAAAETVAGMTDGRVSFVDIDADQPGEVAYQAIDTAVRMIAEGKADALVTGPISKQNLVAAGHAEHGHTEILEDLAKKYFKAPDAKAEMLFVYKNLRLLLLTRHIALGDVPGALAKPGAIAKPLKTLIRFLRDRAKVTDPKIAILGVNPHSGEVGGDEERKLFAPVINAVNQIGGTHLAGPFSADGFFRSLKLGDYPYDAIVAAYHDQGLIPFKMLAGYEAVNMTIGLPFVRTSVSHGTATDIAGKGIAREDSLIAALHAALGLV